MAGGHRPPDKNLSYRALACRPLTIRLQEVGRWHRKAVRLVPKKGRFRVSNPIKPSVGLLDSIKRWRLTRQGLSSGKKRRVHEKNQLVQALECSQWVRWGLYLLFVVGCWVLVLEAGEATVILVTSGRRALCGLALSGAMIGVYHLCLEPTGRRNSRVVLVLGGVMLHLLILQGISLMVETNQLPREFQFLLMPVVLAPMVHTVLLSRRTGAISAVAVSVIGSFLLPAGDALVFLVFSLLCGLTAVTVSAQMRKRVQLLRAGIYAGAVGLLLSVAFGRIDIMACFGPEPMDHLRLAGASAGAAFGTGVATALLVSGILPALEAMFQLTTDISWLELSDLNHKLLRRLQLEAPGTFHHSLIVAALAESAAEAVGAKATLCRACAYFHDIGKLTKPEYFIENQHNPAENPHNSLTPTMSALVIFSHVKDGVDLAVKHKLNPRIIDVIQEHHGDSLVIYFYRRAQDLQKAEMEKVSKGLGNPEDVPQVDEKNFRYTGPRPRTRESGIISLSDAVESASRSLSKPTPAKIRALIEEVVQAKLRDGQLDDCQLSLYDLARVKESFANTLRGMLHSRIDYPKDDERSGSRQTGEPARPQGGDPPSDIKPNSAWTQRLSKAGDAA
jgi:putative nucleotidyltransferase with HDIG domain